MTLRERAVRDRHEWVFELDDELDVFDYPIGRHTDQYDRLAEAMAGLYLAADQVEDWTGICLPMPRLILVSRFPVHDAPMGMP